MRNHIREHTFKSVIAVNEQKTKSQVWYRHARIGHQQMHAAFICPTPQVIFARAIFVRPVVDRINLAIRCRGCGEQNRRTGKVAPDLEHVSGRRFYGLPQDCRFVEPLTDQTAIATIASEDPGQIFEAFSPGMRRFFHPVDKSLSRHSVRAELALSPNRTMTFCLKISIRVGDGASPEKSRPIIFIIRAPSSALPDTTRT